VKATPQKNSFEETEKGLIIKIISEPAMPTYTWYREAGQGVAGNSHTSRNWKGDGYESQRILGQFSTEIFAPFFLPESWPAALSLRP
jgi:hypothetical protein